VVGSSRISTGGEPSSAWASETRLEQRDVVHERERGEAAREADLLRLVAELVADAGAFGRHLRVQAQHAHLSLAGRQRGG
jgi:hypothetical protein